MKYTQEKRGEERENTKKQDGTGTWRDSTTGSNQE